MLSRSFLLILFVCTATSTAKSAEKTDLLTIDRIYAAREFESKSRGKQWLEEGSRYTTLEKVTADNPNARNIVVNDARTGKNEILVSASHLIPTGQTVPLKVEGYSFSKDRSLVLIYTNSKRVWRRNTRGDYWVLDRGSQELWQIGRDAKPSTLMFAKISPNGEHIAYVRERNIYVEDLRGGRTIQLTETENSHIINGTFDWVYEEELGLRDGFRWSPDGKSIAYWQLNTEGVRKIPLVNNTAGLYPQTVWIEYPKVGQRNSSSRIGVVTISSLKTNWMNVPGDPHNHYIARMQWANNSHELIVQQLNRLQNVNRVMSVNTATRQAKAILIEKDAAWVNIHDEMKWLSDGEQFTWLSERDGWRQLYLVVAKSRKIKRVTSGTFDVIQLLSVDEKRKMVYFIASPNNPTQRYLYCIGLDGSGEKRLTPKNQPGTHSYQISPDKSLAIHNWSSIDTPSKSEVISLPNHKVIATSNDNEQLHKKVAELKKRPTEFFRVDIGDGVLLDGWCMKPPDFDASKKYPLLIYVYGEPAGQTVLDRWRGTSYLWHLMLTQRGYLIMSFDNRGTPSPRGRAWRKHVYRKVGMLAPQEQAAALRQVMKNRPYIDSDRIGVWGWSGGGSMSLNAIFKYPDLYHTAVSIAPVPNQRYYDTIYQERYMGLPGSNVVGYTKGSAINYAHQLKGNLLIVHGTGDDNCHYQTTELLINELIRHNKRFSMMAYPNRTHAIKEGKNTTRHLRTLMTNYLTEKLPAGPRPQ